MAYNPFSLSLKQAIGQKLLLTFAGKDGLPAETRRILGEIQPAGFTLFRLANIADPAQVRTLTASLQQAASQEGLPPLLIAADQEGGQLMAVGEGATAFPGNLALGAANSEDLARRTGQAIGRELAAMGININYAPVLDVLANPKNTMLGTRSFGGDPALVSRLGAALVQGLQSAGVAATAKHFPGIGDVSLDPHAGTPVIPHAEPRLRQIEFPPFEAAIQAGAKLVMTGHVALPALNNGIDLPATLSPAILTGLLRGEMGFDGLVITDALDMKALEQGSGLVIDAIAAFAAGVDLLLFGLQTKERELLYNGLLQAARRGLLRSSDLEASARRVLALKGWLAGQVQPPLQVVACAEHQALALETARRSVTLVCDTAGLLPLHMRPGERLLVLTPQPTDLTPAETSSYTRMTLADEIRRRHADTSWLTVPPNPSFTEITAILERAGSHALVIAGTFNAIDLPGQTDLVKALLASGVPTVIAAMRTPFDLLAFPGAPAYLCTYGIQPVSMQALAEALFGEIPFQGRLPVRLPGL